MYASMFRDFAVILFFILEYTDALPGKSCKIPNADAGTCTILNKCDPLHELHKKRPKSREEDAFFRQSVASCGSRGSKLKVCCPPTSQWEKLVVRPVMYPEAPISIAQNDEILQPVHNSLDNRIQDSLQPALPLIVPEESNANKLKEWFAKWQASQSLSESCGIEINSAQRIVGGNATEIDEYPWLALLEYEPKRFKCGGSLISRSHVVTAAHCLYNPPSKVRLSEFNITSEPTDTVEVNGGGTDNITVVIVEVEWTVQHPDHVFQTGRNDIGLIKMKEEVEYGDFIKPICLPTVDYRNTYFTLTTNFTVAGWGSDNQYVNSEVKRSVFLPYVPMDICSESYTSLTEGQQLCAGGVEGKDSCRGDSGGPLMYEDTLNSNFVLVGIVSFGYEKCGAKDRPGVYTYVYHYVDWIKKTMKSDGRK